MKSRPIVLRTLRHRQLALRPIPSLRPLTTTPRLFNEKPSPENPKFDKTNAPPQSPWKVFVQTLREEIEKNQGWQDNVKQLQGEVDKAADNAAMKRARMVYEKTRITSMIRDNPRLQAAARNLQSAGISVSDATTQALQDSGVTEALERLTNLGRRFAQPIKDSPVGQAIVEALDDLGLQGYEEKEIRRERRRRRAAKEGTKRVRADPDAGSALVSTQSTPSESRFTFIKSSSSYQRFMENYHESDDALYSTLRSVGSRLGRIFDETEQARVIRAIREIDPDFKFDKFQLELKEYIVPEVIDAYLCADRDDLKQWMSEASFNVCWAQIGEYIKKGLISDSRVLEISLVDIARASFENDTVPVFTILCEAQEVNAFRHPNTREVVVGSTGNVLRSRYAFSMTMVDTELENELTGGWKIIQFVRRQL